MTALARARFVARSDHTLGTLMARLVEVHGDRRLWSAPDGRTMTYREAAGEVDRLAGALANPVDQRDRVEPGDRVVLATENGYGQLLLALAVSRAGALPVPINPSMVPAEVESVVADAGAALVVRDPNDLGDGDALSDAHPAAPDDVAALFYTSGTTGAPKGVELSHRALVGQARSAAMWPTSMRRDELVCSLPVAHIMGFVLLVSAACAGIPVHLLARFRPTDVLDAIEERRATMFVGVPAMYHMLLEAGAEERDLRSIRVWGSGADVMPGDLAKRFKAMGSTATLPGLGSRGQAAFVDGYGMVELGGGVAAKLSPPGLDIGLGDSLGLRRPGYRMRVVGPDGSVVRRGEVGELQVRGPGLLRGYWRGETAGQGDDDGSGDLADAGQDGAEVTEGWLPTGDLVRRGRAGGMRFAGRAKDVIVRGGYTVYAVEVEATLAEHPAVLEAAVVGVGDERMGEVPVAVVRLDGGASVTGDELQAWAADRLASYKAPVRVVVVDELPRTSTRKVRKAALRDQLDEDA